MNRFARGLALVFGALAVTSACGGFSVPYEGAHGAKRAKTDVPVYDIDCKDPVQSVADCQYNGTALPWQSIGVFRVPTKAMSNWGRYRVKVLELGANNGCPAIAFRKLPPSNTDGTAIGAFCVDPNSGATAGNGGATPPPVGGIGISVSASATIQTIECNQPSDCPPGMKCTRGVCAP